MRDFIADRYILSPNNVIIIAATCGHTVIVHLARQLCAIHVQEATNMAAYCGLDYVVRLCYNNDKVDLDEVMEWTAEGCHEAVFSLCRQLGATNFESDTLWAVKRGRENVRLFRDWIVTNFDLPMAWAATNGHKIIMRLRREREATDVDKAIILSTLATHASHRLSYNIIRLHIFTRYVNAFNIFVLLSTSSY